MTQKIEERKVRHLGRYWSTIPDAATDNKMLRWLFRLGSKVGEGNLASRLRMKKDDPEFQASLRRLIDWNMVALESASHGEAVRVTLTGDGKMWGFNLTCEEQVSPPGSPQDHLNMAAKK